MKDSKIVFFGPVGAGKTTAIATITNNCVATTEARISDTSLRRKSRTTVAMDYALLESGGRRIHLYGTPGQERFRFMWEMVSTELAHNCSGHIMLLDNARNHPLKDLVFYLRNFKIYNPDTPLVIGVTGSDLVPTPTQAKYVSWLKQLKIKASVFFIDARRKEDVQRLIDEVMRLEESDISSSANPPSLQGEEKTSLDELFSTSSHNPPFTAELIEDIERISSVTGTAVLLNNREVKHSSLDQQLLKELQTFAADIPAIRRRIDDLGSLNNFRLNTQPKGFFMIMLTDSQLLGVHCNGEISLLTLRQEVDNRMQWNKDIMKDGSA
ncbi:ATP/GTP-binding protein [uncultured Amphritea sp.]|mgnify:CR=1 FL=1|uniref:GTP-binding protein n=1 Tax=uncultured Amphritea sp. TaxID=981605 RepID=UPI00260CD338|nr:ATP/GTP-binding protein [uncultured Amphritea sp.]